MSPAHEVIVVGGGPNGLGAAITLARAGVSVLLIEAKPTLGGGARTEELTLPGFHHDTCSAIHPTARLSPFFAEIGLQQQLQWVDPAAAVAHPLDDGSAVLLERSLGETARNLGEDGEAWNKLLAPFVREAPALFAQILGPLIRARRPLLMARFGLLALRSARSLAEGHFAGARAKALFGGCAAHSVLPLDAPATASFGIVLAMAGHAVGWPLVRGGSQRIIDALESMFRKAGGEIRTGERIGSLLQLPAGARAILFDVTPRQLLAIAGEELPAWYRRKLSRFRYGPGVFKMDWALDGPIPWNARECARAATVHVGGTFNEIAASEAAVWRGEHPERPFVLVAQQSIFDDSRAPAGKHTGWAYCHVPNGSDFDMSERMESQIERFAPGFRDRILARAGITASRYESRNENMVGGDLGGGANDLRQFLARPFFQLDPYSTPNPRIFVCSSSTRPGGGVHGMCGYWAARSVLGKAFGIRKLKIEN